MKKSELKDGMVLKLRNGSKALFFDNIVFVIDFVPFGRELREFSHINFWNENLERIKDVVTDYYIDEVFYDGKSLWKRVQYCTLEEAIKSGKPYKHKDMERYCNTLNQVANELLAIKTITCTLKIISDNRKEWLIKS